MLNAKRLVAAVLILAAPHVWAGGTMQLSGEVHSFDAQTIQVTDGRHIYILKRSEITNRAPTAKDLKVGQNVDVTVAFEGIVATRPVKKKK